MRICKIHKHLASIIEQHFVLTLIFYKIHQRSSSEYKIYNASGNIHDGAGHFLYSQIVVNSKSLHHYPHLRANKLNCVAQN